MTTAPEVIYAFNRGLISKLGQSRIDLKRQALSARLDNNWMPRLLGSMMLRPGLASIGNSASNNLAKYLPFIFSTDDTAGLSLIELTDSALRIWAKASNDYPDTLVSRVSVATAITNGIFNPSGLGVPLASWTLNNDSGCTANGLGKAILTGTGFGWARIYQQISVAGGDIGKEHAIRITISQESVVLRVGSTQGDDDYVNAISLSVGTHSIAFVPAGDFYLQFENNTTQPAIIAGSATPVAIESAGVLTLPTPWVLANLSPSKLRHEQSGNIVYVACAGLQQRKIVRWGTSRSWSVVLYQPQDGPFKPQNTGPVTITPGALTGGLGLTASAQIFRPNHVGTLFRLASVGQTTSVAAAGTNQFSDAVEINGISHDRDLTITITGTFSAKVVLQRSVGAPGSWSDVSGQSWTAPVSKVYNDALPNQDIFYRIGIESTYTSGTATCTISSPTGSIIGIARITSVGNANSNVATAIVLTQPGNTGVLGGLGSTVATSTWWEGLWSDVSGWPSAVALAEGRMWWSGKGWVAGSVSDAYESYDDTVVGDSGPIIEQIGSGPIDLIPWMLALQNLILGGQAASKSAQSSGFSTPLTPSDFMLKNASTQGAAATDPVQVDFDGYFVHKSGQRIYRLVYQPSYIGPNYKTVDTTRFVPDLAQPSGGYKTLNVQRTPDTRLHAPMNDGTVAVCVVDPDEDEECFVTVSMAPTVAGAGVIEDVVTLPGTVEDYVYYSVKWTINGSVVRALLKWSREDHCQGGTVSRQMDAHLVGTNSPAAATISLPHLIGEQVVVWADGVAIGTPDANNNAQTFTVANDGTVTLPQTVTSWCAGLPYVAQFQSAKLAEQGQNGSGLTQKQQVTAIGFNLVNTHLLGLKFGTDFTAANLRNLPASEEGQTIPPNTVYAEYDFDKFAFPGTIESDTAICLQAQSPYPCTVTATVFTMDGS